MALGQDVGLSEDEGFHWPKQLNVGCGNVINGLSENILREATPWHCRKIDVGAWMSGPRSAEAAPACFLPEDCWPGNCPTSS